MICEAALRERFGLVGVGFGDAFEAGDGLVDARVVLHGAGAEGVHAEVDGVVPGGEPGEVADDLDLGELGHDAEVCAERLSPRSAAASMAGTSSSARR